MEPDLELNFKNSKTNAVSIRNVYKHYGTRKRPVAVLNNLNMTVPKGAIYGLLGASGCGKTTVLGCIVGLKGIDSGEVKVFGSRPGTPNSGIPGPRVGYMPQEIALFGDFTIAETVNYFGIITNLSAVDIAENYRFLTEFLRLPKGGQFVRTLSGGQQRRVSLAAALIHRPELLILDEPTVGVDPILRQEIWDHLLRLTRTGNTTIIITTHYIEEARCANSIGLMRGGYLLAEEEPEKLIAYHRAETLEDVFVKLCVIQNINNETPTTSAPELPPNEPIGESTEPEEKYTKKHYKMKRVRALFIKNFLWFWRNIPLVLFLLVLPIVQITLTYYCIGHDPFGLSISVVNHELDFNETCQNDLSCNGTRLSCSYIDKIKQLNLTLNYYDNETEAKRSVQQGLTWATIVFAHNYSDAIRNRFSISTRQPKYVDFADVKVYQDMSNQNIGIYIKRYLFESFQNFLMDYMESCDIDRKLGSLPLRFNKAVYGANQPDFAEFVLPGMILILIFSLAVALTGVIMLSEKKEGLLERSMVNGVKHSELIFSHLITQSVFMVAQTLIILVFSLTVFRTTVEGDITLIVVLSLLTGICGMCFGLAISCVCDSEMSASLFAIGSLFPIFMLSGICWPIEGMHSLVQAFSYVLPLTTSTESLRSIIQRGWGLSTVIVYSGFVLTVVWILIFLVISMLLLKYKKS